jgi:tetratricopeptide (TPR) repeat protein
VKTLAALAIAGWMCLGLQSQVPVRTPVPATPAQLERIKAGAKLHDQAKFDDAIALYRAVLEENPDCLMAMYELTFTYIAKKDYAKAIETSSRGTEYPTAERAGFFMLLGSAYDDSGEPAKAVDTYERGISVAPSGALYFNLAITLNRLNRNDEAIQALKQAAYVDPNHISTQHRLGASWLSAGYRTPAILALSRFLILEPSGTRAAQVHSAWLKAVTGGVSSDANGKISLNVDPTERTGEGNFTQADITLGLSRAAALTQSAGKTQAQILIDQLTQWFRMLGVEKMADPPGFAAIYYVPYFVELQKRGYTEAFVYWVSQQSDLQGVKEWIADPANRLKASEFVQWSKAYAWPTRPEPRAPGSSGTARR